jgi:hypothetical protein
VPVMGGQKAESQQQQQANGGSKNKGTGPMPKRGQIGWEIGWEIVRDIGQVFLPGAASGAQKEQINNFKGAVHGSEP